MHARAPFYGRMRTIQFEGVSLLLPT